MLRAHKDGKNNSNYSGLRLREWFSQESVDSECSSLKRVEIWLRPLCFERYIALSAL